MKKKILVIEDERPLLKAIRSKFELNGFDVEEARTVEQALNYMENGGVTDVIWLDHYLLGKESGLDLVAKLKTSEEWKTIPIFVVSNTASPDKVQSYIQLGVSKYYVKAEHRLEEIISEVKSFLTNKK